jgi:signal transduction histidine kinase
LGVVQACASTQAQKTMYNMDGKAKAKRAERPRVDARAETGSGTGAASPVPFAALRADAPVVTDFTSFRARELLQFDAMREERRRFARNIHDGILQALTGAAMQLEAASRLIETDPRAARACLQVLGDLLASEQRELRTLIQKTDLTADTSSVSISELAAVLERIRDRVGRQWSIRIDLTIGGHGRVQRSLADDIFSIVQEGLANVARHARANVARVALSLLRDKVCIKVSDDGCGFPYHGRFDLPGLVARDIGPASLRDRVAARRGTFTLVSGLSGSNLEMSLPLRHEP